MDKQCRAEPSVSKTFDKEVALKKALHRLTSAFSKGKRGKDEFPCEALVRPMVLLANHKQCDPKIQVVTPGNALAAKGTSHTKAAKAKVARGLVNKAARKSTPRSRKSRKFKPKSK